LLENWESEARHFWRVAPKAEVAKIEGAHEGSIASHAAEAQP
jgi:hypothetical protein